MNTENLSTLKIHKLTQAQYNREVEAGTIDENALYLTPDETTAIRNGTITIPANQWVQADAYDGLYYANMKGFATYVNSASTVFVSPAQSPVSNFSVYVSNGVRACEQGFETINFVADTKPGSDIIVNYTVFI